MVGAFPVGSFAVGGKQLLIKIIRELLSATANVEVNGFNIAVYTSQATAETEAFDLQVLLISNLELATAETQVYDLVIQATGSVLRDLGLATATVEAFDLNAVYLVEGFPVIRVSERDGNDIEILTLNLNGRNVRIYRAEGQDNYGNWAPIVLTNVNPYTDEGLDPTLNYKYKASFAVEGEVGGQVEIFEGGTSDIRYNTVDNV